LLPLPDRPRQAWRVGQILQRELAVAYQTAWMAHKLRQRDGWFSAAYARARRQQVEAWSDELLKIADDPRLEPNDRRVRLDTRKWLMSRINPARYDDKVQVAGDPDSPIKHMVGVVDLAQLTGPELDALERFANARIAAKDVQDLNEGQHKPE
jgi:hypothetical protein